jgi:hypothetical protein
MLRQLGADTVYVLFGLPLAVLSISLLVPLFAFGVGTLPLVVVGLGTPTPHPPALPPSRSPALPPCRRVSDFCAPRIAPGANTPTLGGEGSSGCVASRQDK